MRGACNVLVVVAAVTQNAFAFAIAVQIAVEVVDVPFDGPLLSHSACQLFSPGVDFMHENLCPHSR